MPENNKCEDKRESKKTMWDSVKKEVTALGGSLFVSCALISSSLVFSLCSLGMSSKNAVDPFDYFLLVGWAIGGLIINEHAKKHYASIQETLSRFPVGSLGGIARGQVKKKISAMSDAIGYSGLYSSILLTTCLIVGATPVGLIKAEPFNAALVALGSVVPAVHAYKACRAAGYVRRTLKQYPAP